MIYAIEKPNQTQIAIIVRAPWAELSPLLPKAAERISEEIEIEGFRKGKAPYEIIKQKVGEFKILEEAARLCIGGNFQKILQEAEEKEFAGKSFEAVGEPAVAITKLAPGEELEYKITLNVLPPIELPDYKAIAKKILAGRKAPEVAEKEVASAIEWLRESRTKLVTVNRAAGAGDRVEIDFTAKHGGAAVESGESKNHPIILGQGRFLPGFENELMGMKAGEERTFTITVPTDWRERQVAGKELEFAAKMNLVQERRVPEWNDEFARSLGGFSSAQDAEKSIREGLCMEKEEKEKERMRMAMIEAIAAQTKADIPGVLIEREIEKMAAELKESIGPMGLKFEDYLAGIKKTADDLKMEWRPDAQRRVKIALVLREIARKEAIQPAEEEIREAVNRAAERLGLTEKDIKELDPHTHGGEAPEAQRKITPMSVGVDRRAFFDYHRGVARNEKVFRFLETLD